MIETIEDLLDARRQVARCVTKLAATAAEGLPGFEWEPLAEPPPVGSPQRRHADAVADRMRATGTTGQCSSKQRCAIAQYVLDQTGVDVEVATQFVHIPSASLAAEVRPTVMFAGTRLADTFGVSAEAPADLTHEVVDGAVCERLSVALPDTVKAFIAEFDDRRYRDLIEAS